MAGPAEKPGKASSNDCCSVGFLHNALHIFNIVFLAAGLVVLGVGVWSVVVKQRFVALLATSTYAMAGHALLVAGGLVVAAGVSGCVALCRRDRCLLLVYIFTLLLIFVLEATVGVVSYAYEGHVQAELGISLNETFLTGYEKNPEVTSAVDQLQNEFKCCGAIRFEDWRHSKWLKDSPESKNLVPDSCCITSTPNCGVRDHPSNIYYNGCIYRLAAEMREHLNILGGVGLGFCVVQIFGLVLACSLYIRMKDDPPSSDSGRQPLQSPSSASAASSRN